MTICLMAFVTMMPYPAFAEARNVTQNERNKQTKEETSKEIKEESNKEKREKLRKESNKKNNEETNQVIGQELDKEIHNEMNQQSEHVNKLNYEAYQVAQQLKVGNTRSDLEAVFGKHKIEVFNSDGTTQWLYEIHVNTTGEFQPVLPLTSKQRNDVDISDIDKESKVQLLVTFNNKGLATLFQLYYVGQDQQIYQCMINKDNKHVNDHIQVIAETPSLLQESKENHIYYHDKVHILIYHDLAEENDVSGYTITPQLFESQLTTLLEQGYNIIGMDEFVLFMQGEIQISPNAVLLTFDDGYESFYSLAAPVLEKHDLLATHFIIGERRDNGYAHHMTWDQMKELKAEGMSFYNHTYDLHKDIPIHEQDTMQPALTHRMYLQDEQRIETEQEYKDRVIEDILYMEERIEQELGDQRALLAFPFGAYNEQVIAWLKQNGFQFFFSIEPGINEFGQDVFYRINAGSPHITAEHLLQTMQKYEK